MSDVKESKTPKTPDNSKAGRSSSGSSGSKSDSKDQQSRSSPRGAGKSYRELRYQAGRGDGRPLRESKSGFDKSRDSEMRPGSRGGDGDKPLKGKGTPAKSQEVPTLKGKEIPSSQAKSAADLEAKWQKEEEEKRKEEEAKQEEEEKIRKEEEEKQRIQEEKEKKEREDKKAIETYAAEAGQRIVTKTAMRAVNLTAAENRPEDSFFSKLDSSLKKNTAFVKKLRVLTESQKEALAKDFCGLNLTKYVDEVAAALTDAKLKMSDIGCAVHLCSIMHQRYADFSTSLMENWQKYMMSKKEEKVNNPSKYRVDLRFFAELVAVGVFKEKEGLQALANQLSLLINSDKDEHNNLPILSSFCKHCGDDYAGTVPRKFRELALRFGLDIPRSKVLKTERQKGCRNLLKDYYTSLSKHLKNSHKELKNMERHNRKTILTKGELNPDRKQRYEEAYNSYQKLFSNTAVFSDLLDVEMPDLPEDDFKQDEEGGFDVFNPLKVEFQYDGDCSLFEDEESQTFYECLPDLKASIPGILYRESEVVAPKEETKEELGLEEDLENLNLEDVVREIETEKELVEQEEGLEEGSDKPSEGEDSTSDADTAMEQLGLLPPVVEGKQKKKKKKHDDSETGSIMKVQFEAYALSLPNCVNKDLIDKAAIEFCMNFNTKTNRKKLVRALFTVHRTRYDLLPFYSRLVATLFPCMPDVGTDLIQLLKGDFRWHVRKKDQINIESKLKTVRFIGELVKFKLYPKVEALHCLKMLLFDFSHHNIEMACSLLETCGRYLYRSPESHHRTRVYLDVMMRKKSALMMDSRYSTMIENAFYYSNPPELQQVARKVRPPMQEYIRKLLYKDLSKVTTEKVLRQMRKLNWDDPEVAYYATKCMIAVWNVRFNSVHCAANLLAGIAPYHEKVAIQVVDGVLEDMRIGMEVNHPRYNQRRVSCAKYLGELYNYRMVESSVVFKILYSFITFGAPTNDETVSVLDQPEHLFRIRLVCVVLDTCGQYFDKGSSKRKLDCFLVYFQRYYWFKQSLPCWTDDRPFPIDVENLFQDTMESVRSKLKLYQSFEEACKAAEEMENEFKPKIAYILPVEESTEAEASETEDGGLTAIPETDEYSDLSQGLSPNHGGEDESDNSQESTSQSQSQSQGQSQSLSQSQSQTERSQRDREGQSEDEAMEVDKNEDEDEDGEEDEDYSDSDDEDDLSDEDLVLKNGPKYIKCQEDDDFLSAFDKMIDDTTKARNNEALKIPQMDIAVPIHLKANKGKKFELNPEPKEDTSTITFTLMTKRGNKQQFSDLNVPLSAEFATKFKEREQQEKAEKEKMKQVVLGIHERQEEEDYQELIASMNRPAMVNNNRERRVRYQHPKGAPDADLIFGSKTTTRLRNHPLNRRSVEGAWCSKATDNQEHDD